MESNETRSPNRLVFTKDGTSYTTELKTDSVNQSSFFRAKATPSIASNANNKMPILNTNLHKENPNLHTSSISTSSQNTSWFIRELANENYSKARGFLYKHKKRDPINQFPYTTSRSIRKIKDGVVSPSVQNNNNEKVIASPLSPEKQSVIGSMAKFMTENCDSIKNDKTPLILKKSLNMKKMLNPALIKLKENIEVNTKERKNRLNSFCAVKKERKSVVYNSFEGKNFDEKGIWNSMCRQMVKFNADSVNEDNSKKE